MSQQPVSSIGGIVLCGGQSTRMGTSKLWLPFGPETMLQRVVRILRQAVAPVVVVAAPGQDLPPLPDDVLLARDDVPGLGPLAGLAAGLAALRPHVDAAFASSCDAPLLKPEFVRRMIELLGGHDLAVPRDGDYHHPLAAVYRTELADRVRALVAARRLRPVFLIDEADASVVPVESLRDVDPDLESLRNTNRPDDYQAALAIAGFMPADPVPSMPAAALDSGRVRDVRMRGFASRATVDDALAWIDGHAAALEPEPVPLDAAHDRVLVEAVQAGLDVPSFDRAAMDGYALAGSETDGAGDYNPLAFKVIGESLPGRPFAGRVSPGTAVRIMTGAALPAGADAVLPAEFASERGEQVEATVAVPPGKNVGRRGEDLAAGSVVLPAPRRLRPQDLGVLASVGVAEVRAVRRPRVRLVITGEELVAPGRPLAPSQIYEANSWMLRGLVARDGGDLESVQHLPDRRDSIAAALLAPGADVILVSGGSSVGQEDHAPSIVAEHGQLPIHGIAMRPSSPAGLGRLGRALVCLLPGNPVSCLCAYDFFAGRAIRRLGGRSGEWPYRRVRARLRRKIVSAIGRVDYCRVRVEGGEAEPLALSGASILSSTTRADGFVIVPAELEGYGPDSEIEALLYGSGESPG